MGDPIVVIEPWPSAEQPVFHLVVFTADDVWWQHSKPDRPGWVTFRVLPVRWEERYAAVPAADVGGPFLAMLGFPVAIEKPDGTVVEFASPPPDGPVEVRHVGGTEFVTGPGYDSVRWPAPPPPAAPVEMGFTYERADGRSSIDRTFDWTEAAADADGTVKWDGCANYQVGLVDGVYAHACQPSHITELLGATVKAVEIAYTVMEVDYG